MILMEHLFSAEFDVMYTFRHFEKNGHIGLKDVNDQPPKRRETESNQRRFNQHLLRVHQPDEFNKHQGMILQSNDGDTTNLFVQIL